MAAPQVSWYNVDNTSQVSQWDIGTVDAGDESDEFTVLIWNNRGGSSALSDMTSTTITTKDAGGGNEGELVEDTWIQVRVDSLGEQTFNAIGGTTTRALKAESGNVTTSGVIKGTANTGDKDVAGDKANYCKVTLRAVVPGEATAGLVNFLTRVSYQYV